MSNLPPAIPYAGYHGTDLVTGQKILADGWLRPRSTTGHEGNWGKGKTANPSNPELVYVATWRQKADEHARRAAQLAGSGQGCVIEVRLDPAHAVPDEDVILEMLSVNDGGYLTKKLLEFYAQVIGRPVKEAPQWLEDCFGEMADTQVAHDMQEVAIKCGSLPPEILARLLRHSGTLAFSAPLQVIGHREMDYRPASASATTWWNKAAAKGPTPVKTE